MGKNNHSEMNRQHGDRKNKYAMRKLQKGVASVLVGASLLGVGMSVIPGVSGVVGPIAIEAAETGAQIVAFDHYVLDSQEYNLSVNVNAFEIVDGEMIDLTGDVQVIATKILDDRTQVITYSVVGSDGVAKTTSATITYGKDYAGALKSVENAVDILNKELAQLGDEADKVQGQFDDISTQLDQIRAEYDAYLVAAADQDADIDALNARANAIEENINTIMQAITYSLADIAELSNKVDANHAFITGEITRLEDELSAFRKDIEDRVAAMESALPDKATQDEVDAVQDRVDAFLETSGAVEQSLADQLKKLNALYEDIVNGSVERDDAMLEMLSIQEDRLDELRKILDDVSTSSDKKIADLEAELAKKAEPEEIAALEAELATVKEDAAAREQVFSDQIEAAEAINALLKDRINGYEKTISDLEAELERLANEMAVLERILEAVEQGKGDVDAGIVDKDDNVVDIEDPEDVEDIEEDIKDILPDVDEDVIPDTEDGDVVPDKDVDGDVDPDVVPEGDKDTTPDVKPNDDLVNKPVDDSAPVVEDVDHDTTGDKEPSVDTLDKQPSDSDSEPFLGEDVTGDQSDDVIVGGEDISSTDVGGSDDSDTPVSNDNAASPDANKAGGGDATGSDATGGEKAGGGKSAGGGNAEATAATLPQTGAGFGALASMGVAGLSAMGAGVVKFIRKR